MHQCIFHIRKCVAEHKSRFLHLSSGTESCNIRTCCHFPTMTVFLCNMGTFYDNLFFIIYTWLLSEKYETGLAVILLFFDIMMSSHSLYESLFQHLIKPLLS